jgi:ribokinase
LRNVAFVMPNRQEAELLLGTTIRSLADAQAAATQLRAFTAGTIIITLDQDGCVVLTPNKDQPVPIATTPVAAVDTTAAGDIFRGVFAHTYLESLDIEQAASLACPRLLLQRWLKA